MFGCQLSIPRPTQEIGFPLPDQDLDAAQATNGPKLHRAGFTGHRLPNAPFTSPTDEMLLRVYPLSISKTTPIACKHQVEYSTTDRKAVHACVQSLVHSTQPGARQNAMTMLNYTRLCRTIGTPLSSCVDEATDPVIKISTRTAKNEKAIKMTSKPTHRL